jgi:hypothetical protein
MNKLWTVALVLAVAAAAFLLGRQTQTVPAAGSAPTAAPASVAAAPAAAEIAAADGNPGNTSSKSLSAQPPQTFRGPDGLPRLIAYEVGVVPDSSNPELVKAAMLADMKNHPRNIERSYDLSAEEIAAIVAGTKPFPEILLPKPGAAKGK